MNELSKGIGQKVQFVTTIAHEPELLIFDEPFSGFDPINADILKREILELKEKGKTTARNRGLTRTIPSVCAAEPGPVSIQDRGLTLSRLQELRQLPLSLPG